MKSLINKNLLYFLGCTTLILILCLPILYWAMEKNYAKDLDELIEYRRDHFKEEHQGTLKISDIHQWNEYNYDLLILEYNDTYPLDQAVMVWFDNPAEGHPVDYRTIYTKIEIEETPFILMSRIAMVEPGDMARTLAYQYGILFIILSIIVPITQHLISKKLWKPFYKTLDKIEDYSLEKGALPEFEETNTLEFNRLNKNITKLLSKNLTVYKQQKEFIENASHELQTPLAVFRSQLDLLMQDKDLTEEQTTIVQSLYDVSSRMTRLNKNLLLLAKIENQQYQTLQEFDFSELLNNQIYILKNLAEEYGIEFSVDIKNSIKINANITLTESLINNLIVNAINHNISEGSIKIIVSQDSFSVMNTGEDKPLDQNKIFNRFSRTSERKRGVGLGLSIVYQICKFHSWNLTYEYENNLHVLHVRF